MTTDALRSEVEVLQWALHNRSIEPRLMDAHHHAQAWALVKSDHILFTQPNFMTITFYPTDKTEARLAQALQEIEARAAQENRYIREALF